MNSQILNPCSPIRRRNIQSTRNSSPGSQRIDYPTFYGNSEVEKYHNLTFFPSEESDLKLPQIKDRTSKPQATNQYITFSANMSVEKSGCSSVESLCEL
jgi:hypothetical protein